MARLILCYLAISQIFAGRLASYPGFLFFSSSTSWTWWP